MDTLKEDILILWGTSAGGTLFSVPISPSYIPREILAWPSSHHLTRNTLIKQFSTNLPHHDCLRLRDPISQSAMGKLTGSFPSMHTAQARVTMQGKTLVVAVKRKFPDVTPTKGSKWLRAQLKSSETHPCVCATLSYTGCFQPATKQGRNTRTGWGNTDLLTGVALWRIAHNSHFHPSFPPSLLHSGSESIRVDDSIFTHTAIYPHKSLHI